MLHKTSKANSTIGTTEEIKVPRKANPQAHPNGQKTMIGTTMKTHQVKGEPPLGHHEREKSAHFTGKVNAESAYKETNAHMCTKTSRQRNGTTINVVQPYQEALPTNASNKQ